MTIPTGVLISGCLLQYKTLVLTGKSTKFLNSLSTNTSKLLDASVLEFPDPTAVIGMLRLYEFNQSLQPAIQ